ARTRCIHERCIHEVGPVEGSRIDLITQVELPLLLAVLRSSEEAFGKRKAKIGPPVVLLTVELVLECAIAGESREDCVAVAREHEARPTAAEAKITARIGG